MPQAPAKQFSGIFVSYRRDDSSGHAGRLFDKLVSHFGKDRIFMDIDTIEPGEDFVTVIENAVGSCEILIAIIGRNWLSGTVGATGRLDNPNDFVRVEITTALRRDIRVIPVLVQRASMPKPQDLPDDLAKLTRRNAVELSDVRWQSDVDQLISFMDRVLAKREEAVRLAEAARQTEEERQRGEAAEKRRVDEENQLRLAEEEAKQRAVEARREEEEREHRRAEERAKLEAQEASRRRVEEERAHAEAEERSRAEQVTERGHVETEQQAERRRLEEEKQARAEKERMRPAGEAAERQRTAEQALKASREEKQTKLDSAITKTPSSTPAAQLSHSHPMSDITDGTPLRQDRSQRTRLLVIIGSVALLVIVVLIWISQRPDGEQQSAKPNATPASTQTGQTTSAPPTTAIQPPSGMVFVPGGEFMMGRDDGDESERPEHPVTLKPFFIDTYEVTNEDYEKFVIATNHRTPATWKNGSVPSGAVRKPVTGATWADANDYARWAGKRLPTEQEWEFAARGTDGRRYPWGNDWQQGLANANGAEKSMADVGAYKGTSPFGTYDMIGNAWEWTASDFREYPGGHLPANQPSGELKVIRGGSYESTKEYGTTSYRVGWPARYASASSQTGFRCVKDVAK